MMCSEVRVVITYLASGYVDVHPCYRTIAQAMMLFGYDNNNFFYASNSDGT